MKKFLSVLVLISALIVGGCGGSSFGVSYTVENEIRIESENEDDGDGGGTLKVPEGSGINVIANISAGKFIITVEGKEYEINQTSEVFIDVSAGEQNVSFLGRDGLTGDILLRVAPKK